MEQHNYEQTTDKIEKKKADTGKESWFILYYCKSGFIRNVLIFANIRNYSGCKIKKFTKSLTHY